MVGPGHILLVDDDEDLRHAMAFWLRCDGRFVVEAENGEVALSALASPTVFRLVVLDLMMPVMDGPSFLVRKAKGEHAALPVVIFSSSPCIALEGLAGVVSVVPKMQGIEALLAAIALVDRATPLSDAPARGTRV
jgi:CheY-like chemotaxis protein